MASDTRTYHPMTISSGYFAASSTYAPTRGPPSHPSYVNDNANILEAFAEVNRALESRNARQSLPRRIPKGPREPRVPNPEIMTYQPRLLKKDQLPEDISQCYPPSIHAHTSQDYGTINPRFSIASSPAALYPDRSALPSKPIHEVGRYEGYEGSHTSGGHTRPNRPILKLITPSSPQWATVGSIPKRERSFQEMGYRSTSLKDRSSCVIM